MCDICGKLYCSPRCGGSTEESYYYCDTCGRAMRDEGIEFGINRICKECFEDASDDKKNYAGWYQCVRCGEWTRDLYEGDLCEKCDKEETI